MDTGLGRAHQKEDVAGKAGHRRRKGRCGDQSQYFPDGPRHGRFGNLNVCLEGAKSMPSGRMGADLDRLDAQCFDCRGNRLESCTGVEQRAQQHVAGRACGGIDPDATAAVCHGHLLARMRNSLCGSRPSLAQGGRVRRTPRLPQ